jgi:acyl carrier protein
MAAAVITAGDLAAALAEATGDESLRSAALRPGARLDGDLCLDSLDLVALGAVLRDRYGTAVDLVGFVAGLGLDELIGLTVSDVTGYVNRCRQAQPRAEQPRAEQPAGPRP